MNPSIVTPVPDLIANTFDHFSYQIPYNSYYHVSGNKLTLTTNINSYSSLVNWLYFNPETWSFYGVPDIYSTGSYDIDITITDGYGGIIVDTFLLSINSKPIVSSSNGYVPNFSLTQGSYTRDLSLYF